jgi:hypothetical protein
MAFSRLNRSALAMFAQTTHIPSSAHSTGFCAIWVCTYYKLSSFQVPRLLSSEFLRGGPSVEHMPLPTWILAYRELVCDKGPGVALG